MDERSLDKYRRSLEERQRQILRSVAEMEKELRQLESEREIEFVDRAQAEIWEQVLAQLDEQERRELEEIAAALGRIELGSYGTCEGCGQAIASDRLDALPWARLCVDCQTAAETST